MPRLESVAQVISTDCRVDTKGFPGGRPRRLQRHIVAAHLQTVAQKFESSRV